MTHFSFALQTEFASAALPRTASEVQLFRTLQYAFARVGRKYAVEEYHGSKSQVRFIPTKMWRPGAGRCELADLLVITYQRRPSVEARFTFLQCKRDRTAVTHSLIPGGGRFSGNYEQWDLLHNRPLISSIGTVRPPTDVLRSATLRSVGSFGIFGPHGAGWDMTYVSADQLQPAPGRIKRYGPLSIFPKCTGCRTASGYVETTLACCLRTFGCALESGTVGTPMFLASPATQSWLAAVLTTMAMGNAQSYAGELAHVLRRQENSLDVSLTPSPNVVLIVVENGAVPLRETSAG